MKYIFDQKIDNKNKNKYIGFCYSVEKNEHMPWDDIDYNKPYYFAKYEQNDEARHIDLDINEFKLVPMVKMYDPKNKQRSIIVIFGKAGSGKSVLTNRICELYNIMNNNKKNYFITNNNYMKDVALNHDIYEFMNLNQLIKKYSDPAEMEKFRTSDEFDDSLIVPDDIY